VVSLTNPYCRNSIDLFIMDWKESGWKLSLLNHSILEFASRQFWETMKSSEQLISKHLMNVSLED
jgi:hypothetical protein